MLLLSAAVVASLLSSAPPAAQAPCAGSQAPGTKAATAQAQTPEQPKLEDLFPGVSKQPPEPGKDGPLGPKNLDSGCCTSDHVCLVFVCECHYACAACGTLHVYCNSDLGTYECVCNSPCVPNLTC